MTRKGFSRRDLARAITGALALVSSASLAFAQTQSAHTFTAQDADLAFEQLKAEVPGLRASWDFEKGFPSFIFGRAIDLFVAPANDAEYEAAARRFVDTFPGLFGFTSSVLVTTQVKHLDLSSVGTTDKTAVGFAQVANGMPVVNGSVSFLFNSDGKIVGIENNGVPNVDQVVVVPTITEAEATLIAQHAFNHQGAKVLSVDIAIVPNSTKTGPALAWIIELGGIWDTTKNLPLDEKFSIDAHTGEVIRRETQIHTFTDLTGHLNMWATPGTKPDEASNPTAKFNAQRVHITSAVGNTDCDAAGEWRITYSGSAIQTVTFAFGSSSLFAWVTNKGGSDFTYSKSVTPGTKDWTGINTPNPTEFKTAQMNAQHHGVNWREWVKSIDSTETHMDFRQHLNVNINASCNAYYDGSSTNYYKNAGGCNNTAYSTVVDHETGHWANDKFGSGNGGDGFGEGAADTWAMYIMDTPIIGEDFFVGGGNIRDGRNTRQYCGSCGAGCYGEVHTDGEVLMGAMWKVRDNLNISQGNAAGDAIANSLLLRWFQVYNAYRICQDNDDQLLTLDDDNGNLSDGTPHSADIDGAFKTQGFPGYY